MMANTLFAAASSTAPGRSGAHNRAEVGGGETNSGDAQPSAPAVSTKADTPNASPDHFQRGRIGRELAKHSK